MSLLLLPLPHSVAAPPQTTSLEEAEEDLAQTVAGAPQMLMLEEAVGDLARTVAGAPQYLSAAGLRMRRP